MSLMRKIFGIKEPDFNILDEEDKKELRYGIITYSRLFKGGKIYTNAYWDFFAPLPSLYPSPRVLMIGLGGGTILFQFKRLYGNKVSLSAVEIDQRVAELYRKFMADSEIDAEIIIADGAKYLETHRGYDIIILDAYIADYIPKPFLTDKFVENAYAALNKEGVLAINYAMSIKDMLYFNSYMGKLEKRFNVYRVSSSILSGNTIIVCSKGIKKAEMIDRIKRNFDTKFGGEHVLRAYENMY